MSTNMQKEHPQSVHGEEHERKYGAFQNKLYKGSIPYAMPLHFKRGPISSQHLY